MSIEEVRQSANKLFNSIYKRVIENNAVTVETINNGFIDFVIAIGVLATFGIIVYYFWPSRIATLEHNNNLILGFVKDIYAKTLNNEQAIGVLACFGIPAALHKVNASQSEILAAMFKAMGLSELSEENKRLFDVLLHPNIKWPHFEYFGTETSKVKGNILSNRIYGVMKPKEYPHGFVPFSGEGRTLGTRNNNLAND
jgi:hypothetical protein